MKTVIKPARFLVVLITLVFLSWGQFQGQVSAQQPGSASAVNNVQLVIEGKVVKVHDGDTVTVLDQNSKKFTIRLQGIDAPELKQEFGAAAQKNLSGMVLGKQVTIVWNKVDKYRRTVGTIMLDGRDINIEQVKAGVAWHFKKYEDEQSPADRVTYAAAEQMARAAKLGLWSAAKVVAPGDWRQETKLKRWGPPPPQGTIIGTANSRKYHRPDCPGYRDMAERNRVFFKSVAEAEAAGFKRAGNCPAEITTTVTISGSSPTATTVSNSAVTVSTQLSVPAVPVTQTATTTPARKAQEPSQAISSSPKIIGNKNSKLFHQPWCSGYERVSEKNRIYFDNAAEAEAAGFKRAGNCHAEPPAAKSTDTSSTNASATVAASGSMQKNTVPGAVTLVRTTPTDPATEGDQKTQSSQSTLKVVGNKNSKIFHLPGCSGYDRVSEKNRVYFNSAAEAESGGYRIAKNCSAAGPN